MRPFYLSRELPLFHSVRLARLARLLTVVGLCGIASAWAQTPMPMGAMKHEMSSMPTVKDTRIAVHFPAPARENILMQMRDHLAAISEIQELLAKRDFDGAGKLAEQRLGMGSMQAHGGHEAAIATHMPAGMRELGGSMHRAASRFATASQDAAVSDKIEPALAALSEVTKLCVACHTTYKAR